MLIKMLRIFYVRWRATRAINAYYEHVHILQTLAIDDNEDVSTGAKMALTQLDESVENK